MGQGDPSLDAQGDTRDAERLGLAVGYPLALMNMPLTPLEFMRRTRRLYPEREAVIDGDLRLTYEQFFDHCDRWSAACSAWA